MVTQTAKKFFRRLGPGLITGAADDDPSGIATYSTATGIGTLMGYFSLDPIKALVWSAIVNGVISVPIMAALMWIGQSKKLMSTYTISTRHRFFGWSATLVMATAVTLMLYTSIF